MVRYDSCQVYQLDELQLYLPRNTHETGIYFRLIDADRNETVVKLEKTGRDGEYNIYQVSLDNTLSIVEGETEVIVLIFRNNTMKTMNVGKIHITYDNFSVAHRLYLIGELSKDVNLTYRKIEELTRMNLQIYEDVKEVVGK